MIGNKIYLRFNKQDLYRGKLRLDDSDDIIKVVIHINTLLSKRLGLKNILKELGIV